jgi:glycosyltransferase involved in cell wall biosynthesis
MELREMIIAYDVSHIRQRRAGIGRLATSQIQGLIAADRKHTYLLHGWAPDLDVDRIQSLVRPNVRLSIAKIPGVLKRIYWNRLRFPSLETVIGPFDVFHCAEPLLPPVGKRKSIISFNDSAYYKFPHFYSKGTSQKWDRLYRRALGRATAITVLSENTRSDLVEMMDLPLERIQVVRPPTDPIFTNVHSRELEEGLSRRMALPEEFVLYVGTLEPRKNIPRLVKAFERYAESRKRPISLVIVGRLGWLYEEVLATINSSPVSKQIMLLNYVADEDLAALYRLASMFLFPSLYEGHGYPVVEAMASGTPVVTSNNSSLKEIGAGAALLVEAENVDDICGAMQRIDSEPGLRGELVQKGLERAAQFTVENAVNAILQLYDRVERM